MSSVLLALIVLRSIYEVSCDSPVAAGARRELQSTTGYPVDQLECRGSGEAESSGSLLVQLRSNVNQTNQTQHGEDLNPSTAQEWALRVPSKDVLDEQTARRWLLKNFHRLDVNEDGKLSLEELPDELESQPEKATLIQIVIRETVDRAGILVVLLILQSVSAFILTAYEDFLRRHLVVVVFLSMLLGVGGNLGNQTVFHILLAWSSKHPIQSMGLRETLVQQFLVGLVLASILATVAFVRVVVSLYVRRYKETDSAIDLVPADGSAGDTGGPSQQPTARSDFLRPACAISACTFVIAISAALVGTALPFVMFWLGVAPEHAGPTIQVTMDILGVIITCVVAGGILDDHVKR